MIYLSKHFFASSAAFVVILFAVPSAAEEVSMGLQMTIPPFISISADKSSFVLTLDEFDGGSQSNEEQVKYRVQANDVQKKRGVVFVRLDDRFDQINLEAKFIDYNYISGDSGLAPAYSGWKKISGAGKRNIANRDVLHRPGLTLDGELTIAYRAVATKDLSPKTQTRSLTVTMTDT